MKAANELILCRHGRGAQSYIFLCQPTNAYLAQTFNRPSCVNETQYTSFHFYLLFYIMKCSHCVLYQSVIGFNRF